MPADAMIFKIAPIGEWANAEVAGRYNGSAVDIRDGYIHFSTAAQIVDTLEKSLARDRAEWEKPQTSSAAFDDAEW